MDTIYETGTYLENNPDWHADDAPSKVRWIKGLLDAHHVVPDTIAEVGCGSGEILVGLSRVFPQAKLSGYDISPQAYGICQGKETDRLSFRHCNFITDDTSTHDVVMAIDVFEHVEDYMSFIRGLKDRGTWKLFHIPLDLSVQGMLRGSGIMYGRKRLGHLHYFFKDTALATLTDCGLEVVGWAYTHGAEDLPNRKLRTRLANIPRKLLRAVNEDFGVRFMGGASMLVLTR